MERVAIIGLGLIGTSIGLGLREWNAREKKRDNQDRIYVVGFDSDLSQQSLAKKMKALDDTAWDMPAVVRDADVVIVATPVGAVPDVFRTIGDHLKHGSVVTDVCSTKGNVMDWARELLPTTTSFVGGHPMAGKTQSTEAAEATLFKGATWCICPSVRAPEAAVQTVIGLVAALEAESQFVDPYEHDGFVGGVSHLPFMLSSVLMNTVSSGPGWRDMKLLSASGFRDVSRLAGGSVDMHRDICLTNTDSIVRWIDEFAANLQEIRGVLVGPEEARPAALTEFFTKARDARADWATAERVVGQLAQDTEGELSRNAMAGQFSQMLFGGLARRRRPDDLVKKEEKKPERADRR
ncbi:MAG: prephenate dehydrogenase/arogenate dehydrogenase family protein [Chloroflexia bacterium]